MLSLDDVRRAQTYISRPDMCTKEGLLGWVDALAAALIEAHAVAQMAAPTTDVILIGEIALDNYTGQIELYRCVPCGGLLTSGGVDAHQQWHSAPGR